jgi:hypothetical protein
VASIDDLVAAVAGAATPEAHAWLTAQLGDLAAFPVAFAGAGRRLGKAPTRRAPWCADECGRAALLLGVIDQVGDQVSFVRDLIRRGEVRERQAVLRVLAELPQPARFVELAIDACRTNVQSVFEAIACDNPYPSAQFADPAFNQMTLKALFIGAPVGRIVGLPGRITDELVRMVEAYASERRAAGRSVPDDAALIRRTP